MPFVHPMTSLLFRDPLYSETNEKGQMERHFHDAVARASIQHGLEVNIDVKCCSRRVVENRKGEPRTYEGVNWQCADIEVESSQGGKQSSSSCTARRRSLRTLNA